MWLFVRLIAKNKSNHSTHMEQKETKWLYRSPIVAIVDLNQEGVICASDVVGENSINNWGDGGTTNDELNL